MLATMWDQLDSQIDPKLATITTDLRTSHYFAEANANLRRMYDTPDLSVGEGIEGNALEPRVLDLNLCTPGHLNPHLRLRFLDYSGDSVCSIDRPGELEAQINQAHCCFVMIDAPALMEMDGRFHARRNLPDYITGLLRSRIGKTGAQGMPVVFIVTKGEKYIRQNREHAVLERVQSEYGKLLEILHQKGCSVQIGLIETLGTIVFTEFKVHRTTSGEEYPIYQFQKIAASAVHSPRHITYPIQVILKHAVAQSIQQRRNSHSGFNWLRDLFDRDAELRAVAQDLLNAAHRAESSNGTSSIAQVEVAAA